MTVLALVASACSGGTDVGQEPGVTPGFDSAEAGEGEAGEGEAGEGEAGEGEAGEAGPTGEFADGLSVVIANSPGTLTTSGSQRVMTALLGNGANAFLGGDDQPVDIAFTPAEGEATERVDGAWLTTNAAALGLYVSYFEFPSAGLWEVRVEAGGEDVGGTLVEVVEESPVPNIGDEAPRSDTLVAEDPVGIAAISTDPVPVPTFYELTIAEAVTNDRPSVIAFATPAFCQTALCGPTMETVKAAVDGRDELDVVHVEPFDLALAPSGELVPIEPMADWGLVTEPWVFVVDGEGRIAASFEGIIGLDELQDALDRL